MRSLFAACLSLAAAPGLSADEPKKPDPASAIYVEFDFSTLPRGGQGRYKIIFTVLTADKDLKLSEPGDFDRRSDPADLSAFFAEFLNGNRFKAEVVGKTKVRVYGRMFNDKLIPATKGKVESADLTKDELPKVKNPQTEG